MFRKFFHFMFSSQNKAVYMSKKVKTDNIFSNRMYKMCGQVYICGFILRIQYVICKYFFRGDF